MKACKILTAATLFAVSASFSTAQKTVTMPSLPSMPVVSSPSIGNGFYVPGSAGFYSGQKNVPAGTKNESQTKKDISDSKTAASTISSASIAKDFAAANSLSEALTARDLNSMDNMGLLGSFSNILGSNNSMLKTNTADTALLNQILTELNDLKNRISGELTVKEVSQSEKIKPSILRFLVNNHDINQNFKTVYFSKPESDGSFLLTGDRKYIYNNQTRSETFHMLFKAKGTSDGGTIYSIQSTITQDQENPDSLLFQLCSHNNLTAKRTGNFVTLHENTSGLKADLLLSMD